MAAALSGCANLPVADRDRTPEFGALSISPGAPLDVPSGAPLHFDVLRFAFLDDDDVWSPVLVVEAAALAEAPSPEAGAEIIRDQDALCAVYGSSLLATTEGVIGEKRTSTLAVLFTPPHGDSELPDDAGHASIYAYEEGAGCRRLSEGNALEKIRL